MDWKPLTEYLSRFKTLTPPETVKKDICIDAVTDILGVTLDRESLDVQGERIFLNLRGVYKNEILLHKEDIMSKIKENPLGVSVSDIY